MTAEPDIREIDELRRKIRVADDQYYNRGFSDLSDAEYDRLFVQLRKVEQAHPDLITADSPTQRPGGAASATFAPVRHVVAMLSLDNAFSPEELTAWADRVERDAGGADVHFLCEIKVDGVAINLLYEDGRLTRALTRGNGRTIRGLRIERDVVPGLTEAAEPVERVVALDRDRVRLRVLLRAQVAVDLAEVEEPDVVAALPRVLGHAGQE